MRKYVVYRHLFPNGKSYIGITSAKPIPRRWRGGSSYKAQSKVYHAIQKYGWKAVRHEILVESLTLPEANILEKAFIEVFNSVAFGYNVSAGGGGSYGIPCSDEKKAKISKANKGKAGGDGSNLKKYLATHGAWNKGKPLSDEHYRKIAEERKKRCNKAIACYSPFTHELITVYESCTVAAQAVGVTKNNISRCAHGGRKTAGGYEWRYLDESG